MTAGSLNEVVVSPSSRRAGFASRKPMWTGEGSCTISAFRP